MVIDDETPAWAHRRVQELRRGSEFIGDTFARYIASKEEPPVDPLVLEARTIALRHALPGMRHGITSSRTDQGAADHTPELQAVLEALRRGIELAKEQSS